MEYKIQKYSSEHYELWNKFVAQAKNATFLFHRDFMEYHQDRFQDFSLLIFDEKNILKAILPANRVGDVLHSHQGLTYGGLVLNQKSKLQDVIEMLYFLLKYLNENSITSLYLKQLPAIYHESPSDEMEYLSFILNAKLIRRDSLSVINLETDFEFSSSRAEGIKRGADFGLEFKEEHDFTTFWNEILLPNLEQKYNTKPVHSLEEMTYLKSKFPNNIRQFNVYKEGKIIAGTTVFESDFVSHSQYISADESKNTTGSLDFLHNRLITYTFRNKKYFDFGISNENQGQNINQGLLFWKEGFGARTIVQNFYEIETKNYRLLENVLI
ncbi:GNAT family N-acetyltransferase [Flavobacterium lacisediminis]|uniref:GNAT family N-acetyltransferase n=1 Tax=Flavobacterium lacisediminis TaxID=2989705 RepID=A0ABT3EGC9_9FLAO|nr:GNAT family N-acetyltransferase [Flavobacterium lacisediminis]MCW1147625.1 GNAT family N-acetyltransferase [Flavobacterium lacisediminis]